MRGFTAAPRTLVAVCIAGMLATVICIFAQDHVPASIRFRNIYAESGMHAEMRCGGPEKKWIPEANGSGAAWLGFRSRRPHGSADCQWIEHG